MSAKNRDEHNRWRNVTVAFRVSPEEDRAIRDREKEQKRLRRIQRQRHNIEAR